MNILSTKTLLAFFDCEATGLYSDSEDVTQLAAKSVGLEDGNFTVCKETNELPDDTPNHHHNRILQSNNAAIASGGATILIASFASVKLGF